MEVEIEGPAKDSSDPIYRYILRKPTKIEAVTTYTIGALFTGSSTYYGERGMKEVNEAGVDFSFETTSCNMNNDTSESTG